jgi:hypothetical protein
MATSANINIEFYKARIVWLLKDWSHNIPNLDSVTKFVLEQIKFQDIMENEIRSAEIVIPNIVSRLIGPSYMGATTSDDDTMLVEGANMPTVQTVFSLYNKHVISLVEVQFYVNVLKNNPPKNSVNVVALIKMAQNSNHG